MEYNGNNALKIEYFFFHIPKNKGQKKMEKEHLLWKMNLAVTFPSHFSHILCLIRDLPALIKYFVYVFDSYWFILTFYLKKGHKKMICNRAFLYIKKNFCKIIFKKPRGKVPPNSSLLILSNILHLISFLINFIT